MEQKVCLDTNVLVELVKGNEKIKEFIEKTEALFTTTAINVFEIWHGRRDTKNVSKLIESLKIYDFDYFSAKIAGDIIRELKKEGELLDIRDVFIASVCIAYNLELITLDKHFQRLKRFGLKLKLL